MSLLRALVLLSCFSWIAITHARLAFADPTCLAACHEKFNIDKPSKPTAKLMQIRAQIAKEKNLEKLKELEKQEAIELAEAEQKIEQACKKICDFN